MSDGTTHWAGCSESGAKHYKCALLEISRLRDTVTDLRNKLEKKAWFSAYEKKPWVGLTDIEAADCWSTSAITTWENFEAKLKEKNCLEKKLETAGTYADGYENGYQAGMAEKKPWVGLTDEDREECLAKNEELGWWGVVNAIEQSLKEKNDG